MKKIILLLLISFSIKSFANENVLTIGDENVSLKEFENIFFKNNDLESFTKEYLDEYMELFINFKLKVKEAESLGMDTLSTFVNELEGYRKQLSKPYLKDKEFEESLLNEAYERTKYDLNVSHILIAFENSSTKRSEKEAFDKINSIRDEILSGNITFERAAIMHSDDRSSKINQGNLGYFTSFMMVYPFESAAYNCEVGQICGPVRTKYGLHLLKLNDKRKALGEVQVSHIMFKTQQGNKEKNQTAKTKIFDVYEKLNEGQEFEDLAERFSEDKSSAVKGGKLPPFGVGKMVPVFEDASFDLKKINDYSKPFESDFGWHIVKLISKKPILPFDELKSDLKRKIERDSRANLSQESLFKKLRKDYNIVRISKRIKQIKGYGEKSVYEGNWDGKNAKGLIFTLFMIDNLKINQQDFVKYLVDNQEKGSVIDDLYEDFINLKLLEVEESNLSKKYPEYKALLKEYRDGILLFDLTNKLVWGKAVEDTIGLNNFYESKKNEYLWNERVEASIYTCSSLAIAKQVRKAIYRKQRNQIENSDIIKKINKDNSLNLKIESGKFEKGENKILDSLKWKKGISNDIKSEKNQIIIVHIESILPPSTKSLSEVKGKVISEYQNELDKNWIKDLRQKYKYSVNYDVLYSIINK